MVIHSSFAKDLFVRLTWDLKNSTSDLVLSSNRYAGTSLKKKKQPNKIGFHTNKIIF